MKFTKKQTAGLYIIAAILMFIVAYVQQNKLWAILGCANVVFALTYGKEA